MGGTQLGGFTLTIRGHQGGRVTVIVGCILKDEKKIGFFAHIQLIQKELFARLNHDKGQFSIVRRLQSCNKVSLDNGPALVFGASGFGLCVPHFLVQNLYGELYG